MTRSGPFALVLALIVLGSLAILALLVALPFPPADALGLVLGSAVVASTKPVAAFRSFTEFDWMGFGGATRAPNGRAPMIADVPADADGISATVIADACGVEVTLYLPDVGSGVDGALAGDPLVYRIDLADADASFGELNRAYSLAVFVAASLPVTGATNSSYLSGLGFRRIG